MRELVLEDFVDHVGSRFVWRDSDPELAFVLEEAAPLAIKSAPRDMRPPFHLMFRMADQRVFPQSIYQLDHPALGETAIFLVPESQDAAGVRYCATFA